MAGITPGNPEVDRIVHMENLDPGSSFASEVKLRVEGPKLRVLLDGAMDTDAEPRPVGSAPA